MYINIVFFGYMTAVFSGLAGIAAMALAAVSRPFHRTRQYTCVLSFVTCTFIYSLLYFLFYYRENVLQVYKLGLGWRLIDYLAGSGIMLLWLLLIRSLDEVLSGDRRFLLAAAAIAGARAVFSCIMTAAFMDGYYQIRQANAAKQLSYVELLFIVLTSLLILYGCRKAAKDVPLLMHRVYIFGVSAALILLDLSQAAVNFKLYFGKFGISAWDLHTFDPTGPLLTVISLATLIFIFRTDFTPIYIAGTLPANGEEAPQETMPQISLLDLAAEKHRLTRREREIMELVYEGLSNPDIAQQLGISRNTVKQHIHNIFEKMDVSTRIELVHLINSQKEITKYSN